MAEANPDKLLKLEYATPRTPKSEASVAEILVASAVIFGVGLTVFGTAIGVVLMFVGTLFEGGQRQRFVSVAMIMLVGVVTITWLTMIVLTVRGHLLRQSDAVAAGDPGDFDVAESHVMPSSDPDKQSTPSHLSSDH